MSRSSMEEKVGVSKLETVDTGDYDPDAGLSDEERARIVILFLFSNYTKDLSTDHVRRRTKRSYENSTSNSSRGLVLPSAPRASVPWLIQR